MKTRVGFISNSSSSSFSIPILSLTGSQIVMIANHIWYAQEIDTIEFKKPHDAWDISIAGENLVGSVIMDNFDMQEFLTQIGVDPSIVEWEKDDLKW